MQHPTLQQTMTHNRTQRSSWDCPQPAKATADSEAKDPRHIEADPQRRRAQWTNQKLTDLNGKQPIHLHPFFILVDSEELQHRKREWPKTNGNCQALHNT
jgi:hypothetical protein